MYNEEIERTCDILNDNVKIIRKGKAEIVMHPQIAKNIAEILMSEVELYQRSKSTNS